MTLPSENSIAVLGAGSWGTALALVLARNGMRVSLWGRSPDHIGAMEKTRENTAYLPGYTFPDNLYPCADLREIAITHRKFLVVVPSRAFRSTIRKLRGGGMRKDSLIAWGTKGFDSETVALLSEVAVEELGDAIGLAAVSGPSFAGEVAAGLPTALTVAADQPVNAEKLASLLRNERLRVYVNDDLTGVQVGGAVKNVIAVATGISDGLGFGANARAALITRGLVEINRLGEVLGANQPTLMGLAGLGDLVLTCTDDQSRNRRLGIGIGQGHSVSDIVRDIGQEVESLVTAREVYQLSNEHNIEMPITEQVYNILHNGYSAQESVEALLKRDPTRE